MPARVTPMFFARKEGGVSLLLWYYLKARPEGGLLEPTAVSSFALAGASRMPPWSGIDRCPEEHALTASQPWLT